MTCILIRTVQCHNNIIIVGNFGDIFNLANWQVFSFKFNVCTSMRLPNLMLSLAILYTV